MSDVRSVGVLPGPPDGAKQYNFEGLESPPLFQDADSVEITRAICDIPSVSGDEATVRALYKGEGKEITVESRWGERDGRPKILDMKVVS